MNDNVIRIQIFVYNICIMFVMFRLLLYLYT